jgi:hypothetical protein
VSFEERLASVGRTLDDAAAWLRRSTRRSSLSSGASHLRVSVATSVSSAIERSKAAVADQGARMLDRENRSRYGVAALVITCILLTAVITWRLAPSGGPPSDAETLRSVAQARDDRNTPGRAAPQPIREVDPKR